MQDNKTVVESQTRLRKFRPDVQGLRFIAIAMVVLVHAGFGPHGGVDVSFVISGYLVTYLLLRELDASGRINFGKFYARRARRLLPLASLVTIVTLAASWAYASPLKLRGIATDGLFAAFSGLNFRLAITSADYFADHGATPFQHFWSLSVEEQYYAIWPLMLIMVAWIGNKFLRGKLAIGIALATIVCVSFYLSATVTTTNQPWAYFGFQTRAWELAAGALVAVGAKQLSRINQVVAAIVSWSGLAMILIAAFLISENSMPGYAVAWPVLGSVMIIAGGCASPRGGVELILGRSIPMFIGNVSYGWYLWHWPLLILMPDIVGHELTLMDRIRVVLISLAMAIVTFYLIEKPLREKKSLVAIPRRGLALGSALIATSITAALAFTLIPINISVTGKEIAQTDVNQQTQAIVEEATQLRALPSNLQPPLAIVPKNTPSQDCIDSIEAKTPTGIERCSLGDLTSSTIVVLFGDSHAWQWTNAFNYIGLQKHWKIIVITKSGCSPGEYSILNPDLKRVYTECNEWRNAAIEKINALNAKAVVISGRTRREANRSGMESAFGKLRLSGSKLIFLFDTPYPSVDVPNCLAEHTSNASLCSSKRKEAMVFPQFRTMEEEVATTNGAQPLDMTAWFCTKITCPAVINGMVVYYDHSHVTRTYAEWLAPKLGEQLAKAIA